MSFGWRALIKSVAPSIGTALGGPLGGAAGLALAKVLGVPDEKAGDIDALAAAVQGANPDQLLKLKQADQAFAVQMADLGYKNTQAIADLEFKDRDSARGREIAVKDRTTSIGFYTTSFGFFGMLALLAFHAVPESSRDLLNVMLGALGLAWGNQVKYFYGGSALDSQINDMLHRSTPTGAK